MKILLVSLFLPQKKAKHAGGRYVYEILSNLADRHEIHLATRLEADEYPQLATLRPLCAKIHPYAYRTVVKRNLVNNLQLICNYIGFSRYADRLIRAGNYDLVQVEWVEAALLIRKGKTPMILDAHDVITKPAERLAQQDHGAGRLSASLRYVLIKSVERWIMKRFDTILTLSEFDRNYLLKMVPELRVKTVPIPAGLDITDRTYEPRKNSILFLASFKYRKINVEAALYFYRQVFPLVRASIPDARFIIAGYGPPAELSALADKDMQVEVPGFVDDLDRCYKEAEVFVAPILTGGGIIVKIIDALAAGVPVVTTSYGNEGIGATPGKELLIGDDPASMAEGVVKVLQDRDFANCLGASGKTFAQARFSLDSLIGNLDETYRELVPDVSSRGRQAGPQTP